MIEDDKYILRGSPTVVKAPNICLGQLFYDRFLSDPSEKPALVDARSGRFLSYKTLFGRSCALAETLKRNGYGRDSMIGICSENHTEFFTPILAAFYLGAISVPLNHNYTETELLHVLKISEPQIIFCSRQVHYKFISLQTKLDFIEKIVIIDRTEEYLDTDTIHTYITKTLKGTSALYKFQPENVDIENQVAFIMCSSGTTGLPKGVMITHRNVLTKIFHIFDPKFNNAGEEKTLLGILPLFHAYGLILSIGAIYVGSKIVVITQFDEHVFLKAIQDFRISDLSLVPALAHFLSKTPLLDKYDLSSIKRVSCGAAPFGPEVEKIIKKRLKIKWFRQGYGLTEATLAVSSTPLNVIKPGSCGLLLSQLLLKIRDPETGKSLGAGKVGEFCIKGPIVMKGYYKNREATKESFTSDGWLRTGDMGYYDKDGYLYFVERLKELIKYKGFQVAPAELEALLLTHPKVNDAGVIGIPDNEAGELPLAFIVKNPDCDVTEKELQDFVASKLSSPKHLRGGVVFVKVIPKNPSGKILRKNLREMLKKLPSKL